MVVMTASGWRSGWLDPFERVLTDFRSRAAAVKQWMKDHESEIGAVLNGLVVMGLIQPRLETMRDRFTGTEWEYLLNRVDFTTGIGLLVALDNEGSDGIERVLEVALGCEDAFPAMVDALGGVEMADAHQRQLTCGLRFVSRREYDLAVPLLMVAIEGVVALHARSKGFIEPHNGKKHRFTAESGRTGTIGGFEDLLLIDGLGFDEAFADFLRLQVYGGEGDPFRHGLATDGFRHRALMATAALLGWLSAVSSTRPPPEPLKTLLSKVSVTEWGPLFADAGVLVPPALVPGSPRLHTDGASKRGCP